MCFSLRIRRSFVRKYIIKIVKGRRLRINCETTMKLKKKNKQMDMIVKRQEAKKSQP